jgi:hypothetical protein
MREDERRREEAMRQMRDSVRQRVSLLLAPYVFETHTRRFFHHDANPEQLSLAMEGMLIGILGL